MKNPGLIKNFLAGALVYAYRIVKFSAENTVVQAAAASDGLIGVDAGLGIASGARGDVILNGVAEVEYGGGVTFGQRLTSDSVGRAVTASAGDRVIGIAMVSGISGDIGSVLLAQTGLQTADQVQVANLHITTAQLLALYSTPITIIAAPGSNKFLAILDITMYHGAGTAYAGIATGEDIAVAYTNQSGPVIGTVEATGFLDQTTAQTRFLQPGDVRTALDGVPTANAPVIVGLLTGEITTGDFDLYVSVTYKIMDAVLS